MKKNRISFISLSKGLPFLIFVLFLSSNSEAAVKHFEGSGEVTSVDPVYSSVSIKHGAIKNFAGDGETAFTVASADLLKKINRRDLVDFTITEDRGDARIEKITRTGQAPPEEGSKMGKVVQDVLVGTGEIAKGIASPLPPAHEAVSGVVGATTSATGSALNEADTKVKTKF